MKTNFNPYGSGALQHNSNPLTHLEHKAAAPVIALWLPLATQVAPFSTPGSQTFWWPEPAIKKKKKNSFLEL